VLRSGAVVYVEDGRGLESDVGSRLIFVNVQGHEYFGVGALARQAGTTVRTVRYYEQAGLLAPASRSAGGHRRYGPQQRARLLRILTLRELGVPVQRIGPLADGDDPDALAQVLADHRGVLERQRAVLTQALGRIDQLIAAPGRASPSSSSSAPQTWDNQTAFDLLEGIAVSIALTRIYTRTGDDGSTALGSPDRVAKTDTRIEVIGAVDELCAAIGMALPRCPEGAVSAVLWRIQNELFDLGADLAAPPRADRDSKPERDMEDAGQRSTLRISAEYVTRIEHDCDIFNAELPSLRSFVIPGQSSPASEIHFARAVCRRAERRAWQLHDVNTQILHYLNRLSDLLFILARTTREQTELQWQPAGSARRPQL
jgi:cob(I)alamin adenosyltransferase